MLCIFPLILHFYFYFRINSFPHNPSYPLTSVLYHPLEKKEGGQDLSVENQLL